MIPFAGSAILLDIEGTTSAIGFVYDILFPYARRELADFLARRGGEPAVRAACEQIARDAGAESLSAWAGPNGVEAKVIEEVVRLMDKDEKRTGLKALQGLIWEEGYEQGRLKSHVYPDVRPALEAWTERGLDVRIYSSGSVAAQKAFFGRTEAGDLLPFFRGHYDTTTGPKRESPSYTRIAADMGREAGEILFLSDVPAELAAARGAGYQVGLVRRPGNAPVEATTPFPSIHSFAEITIHSA
jgi:enolase-phosphatase E1